ncbi:MAG: transcription elongation factor GreA [Chloroflexota bacterium]|nr:transcription elongation factor GreA [Chloroflexota bacterium]
MAQEQTYLTTKGLREIEDELDHLRTVRREEVADRIHQSKEIGSMGENAEYEEAMNELAFLEGRIQELDAMVRNAVIIPDHTSAKGKKDTVEIGSIVKVEVAGAAKSRVYTIVGSAEASPTDGRISNESPIGQALMGKKAGDEVEFSVPSGKQRLKVLQVR